MKEPLYKPASTLISNSAIEEIRRFIHENGGKEVFIYGLRGEDGLVHDPILLSRGREEMAPALISGIPGDTAIHNHPAGDLSPSKNDIDIASILGNSGISFFIVDNEVEWVNPIVYLKRKEKVESKEIDEYFRQGGKISRILKDFEARNCQFEMADRVRSAINEGEICVIEAGTGTGKTFAYLVPSILYSLKNRERVVVSTNTINLQEQILKKDIPMLLSIPELKVKSALIKGRHNYLCRRRLSLMQSEPTLFEHRDSLNELVEWSRATIDGDRADIPFPISDDLWDDIKSDSETCSKLRCPYYNSCFFFSARKEAAGAQLLIVNHHILVMDLLLSGQVGEGYGIIPGYDITVIDEAHHIEDVAISCAQEKISSTGLLKKVSKVVNHENKEKGLLPSLLRRVFSRTAGQRRNSDLLKKEWDGIIETVRETYKRIEEIFNLSLPIISKEFKRKGEEDEKDSYPDPDEGEVQPFREWRGEFKELVTSEMVEGEFWKESFIPFLSEVFSRLDMLLKTVREPVKRLMEFIPIFDTTAESIYQELSVNLRRLEEVAGFINSFMHLRGDEERCHWFEIRENKKERSFSLKLCSSPVRGGRILKDFLNGRKRSIIYTSATLTIDERFDHFLGCAGLDEDASGRVKTFIFPSPFDYERQAIILVPKDLPPPDTPLYEGLLSHLILDIVMASRGGVFILFTSHSLLNSIAEYLRKEVHGRFQILKQGDMSRTKLLHNFREDGCATLLGTDSFWEGVDVKGESLRCVVVTRLPFRVPVEPFQKARLISLERSGADPFKCHSLPQAILKLKQGVGRLIRSKEERGIIVITDIRIVEKWYGRSFLRSLPPIPHLEVDGETIPGFIEEFFGFTRA